ncbi:YihY/virulence factor BrkB family protein [Corynebacterium pacaense]|uniref:YihY/virulence factor BrkB family protein n=1 Tax=Corynebacterium pacaense TaxID=1816684 RepID=UPI001FE8BB79|nr:YihY/virulence factor BrkB family protein [Corynebacterium pacaense]
MAVNQNNNRDLIDATLAAAEPRRPVDARRIRLTRQGWKLAFGRVLRDFIPDGLLDLAALLSFFSVLSLAPALLVIYSLITLLLSSNSAEIIDKITGLLDRYVPEEQHELVLSLFNAVAGSATGGRIGLVVGVVVALWTSSAYVRAFSRCANTVYGRAEGRTILRQWAVMLMTNIVLLAGAVFVLVSLIVNETVVDRVLGPVAGPLGLGGVLSFLTETFIPVWNWAKWPVILLVLAGLVALIYHVAPNVKPSRFRWLSAGSVFAVSGIFLAGLALNLYFSTFAVFNSYGAVGSVMALLVGMWIFNAVLVVGLKIDAEVSRSRQLQAGLPAERHNLVRPRSITAVTSLEESQEKMADRAREFRESRETPEDDGQE